MSAVKTETDKEFLNQPKYRMSIVIPSLKSSCKSANAGSRNPQSKVAPQKAKAKKTVKKTIQPKKSVVKKKINSKKLSPKKQIKSLKKSIKKSIKKVAVKSKSKKTAKRK